MKLDASAIEVGDLFRKELEVNLNVHSTEQEDRLDSKTEPIVERFTRLPNPRRAQQATAKKDQDDCQSVTHGPSPSGSHNAGQTVRLF